MTHNKLWLFFLFLVFLISCHNTSLAQAPSASSKQVIQLSGQVVRSDSLLGLEGVAVYVPGTTRGTYTQKSGFFSLPAVLGDTIVFAALGHEKLYLSIPANTKESSITLHIKLKEKSSTLPTVNVMPWATEYDLKQAVLRTKLPEEPQDRLPLIPPPVVYKSVTEMPVMDADANFKHGLQQQQQLRDARIKVPDILKVFSIPIKYY